MESGRCSRSRRWASCSRRRAGPARRREYGLRGLGRRPVDTNGTTSGGTVSIYDGRALERRGGAAVPERIDLGGAVTSLCLEQTGTAPVLLFNGRHSHAILSFVASRHVVFDAPSRQPLACIDAGVQAHAAVPSPDESYVVIANQNGKLLTRGGRYLWVADRMGNRIVVIKTATGRVVDELSLTGALSSDTSPDLLDLSPDGDPGVRDAPREAPALGRPARLPAPSRRPPESPTSARQASTAPTRTASACGASSARPERPRPGSDPGRGCLGHCLCGRPPTAFSLQCRGFTRRTCPLRTRTGLDPGRGRRGRGRQKKNWRQAVHQSSAREAMVTGSTRSTPWRKR
ncbi:MAG: hypothetical protein ACRDNG_10565 [Gaiellaceae bacterium]